MLADASFDAYELSFSRFVAESLIAREGPEQISDRADRLGLPRLREMLRLRRVSARPATARICNCRTHPKQHCRS